MLARYEDASTAHATYAAFFDTSLDIDMPLPRLRDVMGHERRGRDLAAGADESLMLRPASFIELPLQ